MTSVFILVEVEHLSGSRRKAEYLFARCPPEKRQQLEAQNLQLLLGRF
jgi:hypothetical protein